MIIIIMIMIIVLIVMILIIEMIVMIMIMAGTISLNNATSGVAEEFHMGSKSNNND